MPVGFDGVIMESNIYAATGGGGGALCPAMTRSRARSFTFLGGPPGGPPGVGI